VLFLSFSISPARAFSLPPLGSRAPSRKLLNVGAKKYCGPDVYVKEMQRIEKQLSTRPMSLKELAEKTGIEKKRVYKALSSLHRSGQIVHLKDDDDIRRYRTVEESFSRASEGR